MISDIESGKQYRVLLAKVHPCVESAQGDFHTTIIGNVFTCENM